MNKPLIDQLVDRFLTCPLPETVDVDLCAIEPGYPNRTGTNLLTAIEAKTVLEHVAGDLIAELELAKTRIETALGDGANEELWKPGTPWHEAAAEAIERLGGLLY